jgi:hypothetical protein
MDSLIRIVHDYALATQAPTIRIALVDVGLLLGFVVLRELRSLLSRR